MAINYHVKRNYFDHFLCSGALKSAENKDRLSRIFYLCGPRVEAQMKESVCVCFRSCLLLSLVKCIMWALGPSTRRVFTGAAFSLETCLPGM